MNIFRNIFEFKYLKKNEKSFYHSSENLEFEKYDVEKTNADSFNFIL